MAFGLHSRSEVHVRHGTTQVSRANAIRVILDTSVGLLELAVDPDRAPASTRAFLGYVDDGSFARHGTFYRAVRKHDNDRGHPAIDVIQGGWQQPSRPLARIEHESTRQTGLRHLDGTVSLARGALGTATGAAFFVCIGEQPALDAGGGRGDGEGFAAFGRVISGMDTVHLIHQRPSGAATSDPYLQGQMLESPVRIMQAFRG